MDQDIRSKNIAVLVTAEEQKRLKVIAALQGKTVSTFVYELLLEHTRLGDDSFFANGVPQMEHKTPAVVQ